MFLTFRIHERLKLNFGNSPWTEEDVPFAAACGPSRLLFLRDLVIIVSWEGESVGSEDGLLTSPSSSASSSALAVAAFLSGMHLLFLSCWIGSLHRHFPFPAPFLCSRADFLVPVVDGDGPMATVGRMIGKFSVRP